MTDPTVLNLTHPIADAITTVLAPGTVDPARVVRRRLTTALRQTLGRSASGWQVRRVRGSNQLAFDIIPPNQPPLTVKETWDLTYQLADLPNVHEAEPSFVIIQDANPLVADESQALPVARAAAGLPTDHLCSDDQAPATLDSHEIDWSARLVDAPCAWQVEPTPTGQRRGKGIRVGHPDSGYLIHPELFDDASGLSKRILTRLERDLVDQDQQAQNPDGQHGLSTSSVIISSEATGRIMGIAPAAELVPLRVTKPHMFGIPAPILFGSGARALRDAVRYAVNEANCHVISISLGWLDNRSLHEAVAEAEAKNVIVCAAAGNYTGIVIWPAAYPEVIAVAGCNAQRQPWRWSARGAQVQISGPAEDVWVASFLQNGSPQPCPSSGTSFAVATVAGVAALWLAHHGRQALLQRYRGAVTLSAVFRHILNHSSDDFATPVGNGFGAGIVNARRVLKTPLPTLAQVQASLPAVPRAALAAPSPIDPIAAAFPDVPLADLRSRLATIVGVPADELDAKLATVAEEVLFHVITDAELRSYLNGEPSMAAARGASAAPDRPALPTQSLSNRLNSRVG